MDYVYVVFSHTHTRIGGMIRFFTRYTYNHVALSIDESLEKLYSFARYRAHSPFRGGFSVEMPCSYCGDAYDTHIRIYRLPDPDGSLRASLERFARECGHYIYNLFAAAFLVLRLRVSIPASSTCLDFAAEMLREERIYSIRALERAIGGELIYEGSMRDYLVAHGVAITRDERFFEHVTRRRAAWEACAAVATLLRRAVAR